MQNRNHGLSVSLLLGVGLLLVALPVQAQEGRSLDLTIRNYGLSIGHAPRVNGVRLNYRDRELERVNGLHLTLWRPYDEDGAQGVVNGVALGLPLTGADRLRGLAVGGFGIEAQTALHGIAVGLLGIGAGENVGGLALAGLGVGAGGRFTGIGFGGLGLGAGEDVRGLALGGLGVGAGRDLSGVVIGGLGAGAGAHLRGLALGGIGVGGGADVTGLALALVGVGAGAQMTGAAVAGLGLGAGERLRGAFAAGAGVGAPEIVGFTTGLAVGSERYTGLALAPAYFRIAEGGMLRGLSASAFHHIKGAQHGVTIGLFNYAHTLHGIQLGVLNYAGNNPRGLRLLPGLNVHL